MTDKTLGSVRVSDLAVLCSFAYPEHRATGVARNPENPDDTSLYPSCAQHGAPGTYQESPRPSRAVDREALAEVLYGQFTSNRYAEWENITDDSDEPRSGYLAAADAVLAFLAARGDAATPTEVEWGVRYIDPQGGVHDHPRASEQNARLVMEIGGYTLIQRDVHRSAWREVQP